MQDILKLAREFDSRADFLMVYIAEAHAADEWPVGNPIRYNQVSAAPYVRLEVALITLLDAAQDPQPAAQDRPGLRE